jgi:hypothetical protein
VIDGNEQGTKAKTVKGAVSDVVCRSHRPDTPKAYRQPQTHMVHVVSKTIVNKWASTRRLERCDIETTSTALTRQHNEAFSTNRSSTGRLRRLREVGIARRMPDNAGSRPAPRGPMPDLNTTTVRHFLHWPQSRYRPRQGAISTECCAVLERGTDCAYGIPSIGLVAAQSAPFLSGGTRRACCMFSIGLCRGAICVGASPSPSPTCALMGLGKGTRHW